MKYVKKYESMKLFLENPVPVLQMAYSNTTPPEAEVLAQVQRDQAALKAEVASAKQVASILVSRIEEMRTNVELQNKHGKEMLLVGIRGYFER